MSERTSTDLDRIMDMARLRGLCRSGEARRIREAAFLSQGDLAAMAGLAAPTVSRWESGARLPRRSNGAVSYLTVLDRLARLAVVSDATPRPVRDPDLEKRRIEAVERRRSFHRAAEQRRKERAARTGLREERVRQARQEVGFTEADAALLHWWYEHRGGAEAFQSFCEHLSTVTLFWSWFDPGRLEQCTTCGQRFRQEGP